MAQSFRLDREPKSLPPFLALRMSSAVKRQPDTGGGDLVVRKLQKVHAAIGKQAGLHECSDEAKVFR